MNYTKWLIPLTLSSVFCANAAPTKLEGNDNDGTIGIGIMALTSATEYKGSDGEVYVFPFAFYQDKDFYISGTEAGVHLWGSGNWWVDGTVSFRLQGFDEDLSDFTKGMDKRKSSLDLGTSLNYYSSGFGYLSFNFRHDIGGVHKGHELTVNYAYPVSWGKLTLTPGIAIQRQSSKLVDYYYGVKNSEITVNREAYSGQKAFNYGFELELEYTLSQSLKLFSSASITKLGDGIKDSSLVDNGGANWVTSIGIVYSF
jgi:outer membrane protein